MKLRCSRCGKELKGAFIQIKTEYQLKEISEEGMIMAYPNASEPTSEMLCPDCFNKYAEVIDSLNQEYQNIYMSNMVEVIDDIQYDDKKV